MAPKETQQGPAGQQQVMHMNPRIEKDRQMILDAQKKGKGAVFKTYMRLSGPGWLQSGITLGGGSLSSSLYLGVLVGFSFMWLQPLAMILGIIMLSAIAYVTLSTGNRPLRGINEHVSPVLGWGWLLASMMANLVWSLPQFALGTAALRQNLLPGLIGPSVMGEIPGKMVAGVIFLAIALTATLTYSAGGRGVKVFEVMIKSIVSLIVLCFIGVVIELSNPGYGAGVVLAFIGLAISVLVLTLTGRYLRNRSHDATSWRTVVTILRVLFLINVAGQSAFIVGVIFVSIFWGKGDLQWAQVFRGLIPDFGLLMRPTDEIMPHIQRVAKPFQAFWTNMIVGQQRDVMISAAATAVGINMTFLLPYSMLRKGWDKYFRGLAIFDLSTGLFIPFIIATGCVVIASSSQFHAVPAPGLVPNEPGGQVTVEPARDLVVRYNGILGSRVRHEMNLTQEEWDQLPSEQRKQYCEALPYADKRMAAMLVKRDAFHLAHTLAPLTGPVIAQYVFGLGVIGMALSAATMLMTINGLCFCELLGRPPRGWTQKFGSLMVSVGALGPFFWTDAAPYLAIPTSVFAMVLLPIAYFAFFLLMNQKTFMGKDMPSGGRRIVWNILMALAAGAASFGSVWSLWSKLQWLGIGLLVGFIVLCIVVHFARSKPKTA